METDLSRERLFINPLWELVEQIGHHFKSCRGTTRQRSLPTSTMAVFVLRKWA
jgi:hypothetical protein